MLSEDQNLTPPLCSIYLATSCHDIPTLPNMNGDTAAREIKRMRPHVPIVMLLGHLDIPKDAALSVDALRWRENGLAKRRPGKHLSFLRPPEENSKTE